MTPQEYANHPNKPKTVIDVYGKPLTTLGGGRGMIWVSERQDTAYGALASDAREICLFGGTRSSKTFLIMRAICMRAIRFPGSRHVALRHRLNAAWASIGLDTFPKVMRICFPGVEYKIDSQNKRFLFPNGSEVWIGGLDDKERVEKILGLEYVTIFINESSQVSYVNYNVARSRLAQVVEGCKQRLFVDLNPPGKSHWTNQIFGLKIDPDTRKPIANPELYARAALNPLDNAQNLDPAFIRSLLGLPERLRKRFYEGLYVDEIDGALWPLETIDKCRIDIPQTLTEYDEEAFAKLGLPEMVEIVVAIDPSGASGPEDKRSDKIGIIVAGKGKDGKGYILADLTCRLSPGGWARVAVQAFHKFKADHICAEINYGGAMVQSTIHGADANIPYREVHASRGKSVRAEPISALYETTPTREGLIRHCGRFAELEEEMGNFAASGYLGDRSPNHVDALVWALTDLFPVALDTGFIEYYKTLSENVEIPDLAAQFGYEFNPDQAKEKSVRLFVPAGVGTIIGLSGSRYMPDCDGVITTTAEDAKALAPHGFTPAP